MAAIEVLLVDLDDTLYRVEEVALVVRASIESASPPPCGLSRTLTQPPPPNSFFLPPRAPRAADRWTG